MAVVTGGLPFLEGIDGAEMGGVIRRLRDAGIFFFLSGAHLWHSKYYHGLGFHPLAPLTHLDVWKIQWCSLDNRMLSPIQWQYQE